MANQNCRCGCIYQTCCKACNYKNPSLIPPLEYQYWNQTTWLNWNTTNGWGPFPSSESGQNNNTYDNLSGYGITSGVGRGEVYVPNGKKLVRIYKYNNRFYERASDLVFINNKWVPVADIPGVEKLIILRQV